ncbi:MAG TPA: ABC transporter permease [Rhizomicrobium sp.]|nr:ABC transporter permease [Rhizomicrobium sp.]
MSAMRQIAIVSLLNFQNLRQRFWQSLVIVAGMACVSGVLLSLLSVTEGMQQAYQRSGDPRNVIIVSHGSLREDNSSIPRDQARIIMNAQGIARASDGSPLADSGFVTGIPVLSKKNGATAHVRLATFGKMGVTLRPTFHLVAGRMFRPGTHELMVGSMAQSKFKGMGVGDKVTMPNGQWPIVGMFATGDLLDGILVGDTEPVLQAMRHNSYNAVIARLEAPGTFPAFRTALTKNPALTVDVMRLSDWNMRTSADSAAFSHVLIYGVSIILAIGALFGCFNTMYAAVETRGREIATLRAIGYGSFPVALSVILEASALSVAGSLIGAMIAWSLYNGVQGDLGWDLFKLTVSPAMFGMAILWAIAVSILGGLLPSLRAARWTVADALRAR